MHRSLHHGINGYMTAIILLIGVLGVWGVTLEPLANFSRCTLSTLDTRYRC